MLSKSANKKIPIYRQKITGTLIIIPKAPLFVGTYENVEIYERVFFYQRLQAL